ncbi:glycosyltransferase [Paraglaciecola sp.]|uniref:glycosyltransferase n=1 Tax=Paraglaciecola sp. TaxID=1920173 RepID=UPI00273E5F17|nr:glycosyltransferase [Paraglaciecola sp.]MDP5033269.1 glycosyltransferase [Paraglaciecola sp.]
MNICFIHNVNVIGGAERVSLSIMRNVSAKHNMHLVSPKKGQLSDEARKLGVKQHTHDLAQPELTSPFKTLGSRLKWRKIATHHKIDIFHCADLLSARSVLNATRSLNVKVICHIHFPFSEEFANWVFNNRAQPHGFIFCSEELQNTQATILQKLCPSSKQWVVHNGVDTEKFTPLDIKNPKPKVGIIANLQFRKGHDDFLEMANILSKEGYELNYEIIGGDILQEPREHLLKEKAIELGLQDQVSFHGQISDVKSILQSLDVVVCASHEEAFPISILEAMSCEKYIVSTNVNGIPEAMIDKETGILVQPFKPDELAKGVKLIVDDPIACTEYAKKARDRVIKYFSERYFNKKIDDIYNSL